MKRFYLSSPGGSGNTYIQMLLNSNAYVDAYMKSHDPRDILENEDHLCILRNPKDAISSITSKHEKENKDKFIPVNQKIDTSNIEEVKLIISRYCYYHHDFLKEAVNKKNLFFIKFDYIMNNQEEAIQKLSKQFNFKLHEDRKQTMNPDVIFYRMDQSGLGSRSPKEKSAGREIIDSLIIEDPLYPEIESMYLDILQSTKNMIQ